MERADRVGWVGPVAAALLLAVPPTLHLLLDVWWAPALVPLLCAAWISIATRRVVDRGSGLVLFVMCATLWFLAVPLFLARRKHA